MRIIYNTKTKEALKLEEEDAQELLKKRAWSERPVQGYLPVRTCSADELKDLLKPKKKPTE